MPTGLATHYARYREHDLLNATAHTDLHSKWPRILASWGSFWPKLNTWSPRQGADRFASSRPYVDRRLVSRDDWFVTIGKYQFLLCPTGNGVQSSKAIEALLVNTIPIVLAEAAWVDLRQRGYPLLVINRWADIDNLSLHNIWNSLAPHLPEFRWNLSNSGWWHHLIHTSGWN